MTTRTGATLGNFDVTEHIKTLPRERHTYCVTDQVDNPSLRAAMSFFDDSLVAPMQPYWLFLNYCQNSRAARDPGTDQGFFAGRSIELEWLLSCVNDATPRVVTMATGAGKTALLGALASASEHAQLRFDADMPTRLHLAVRGVLNTSLAASAVAAIIGTALGFVLDSTSILAGQVQENVRSLEPASERSAHKFDDDVVEVVRDLQHRLGIDLKDVLAAASIKPRTYHSWTQPSAPRPRLTSQGRLWALAQLVDDLPELLDVPLRQWVLADPDRLAALRTGRFDELLEQASHERIQKDPAGTVAGPFHGVGEDGPLSHPTTNRELVVDEQAITEPAPPPSRGSPGLPQA
jgi:hypothetical protein